MKEYIIKVDDSKQDIVGSVPLMDKPRELVRCRECIYWQDNNDGYPHKNCKWREDETPDPEDFCSAGERRDGDG